jgi:hypothetical protein
MTNSRAWPSVSRGPLEASTWLVKQEKIRVLLHKIDEVARAARRRLPAIGFLWNLAGLQRTVAVGAVRKERQARCCRAVR